MDDDQNGVKVKVVMQRANRTVTRRPNHVNVEFDAEVSGLTVPIRNGPKYITATEAIH